MDELQAIYFQVTDLWKRLCEEHNELYNLTCDEYTFLLESDMENLEGATSQKEQIIARISQLELIRRDVITKLNKLLKKQGQAVKVDSVPALLKVMNEFESKQDGKHLFRFNALLIDLIEKLQQQNKKNQIFINKALISLKEIREGAMGSKTYPTYTAKGGTRVNTKSDNRSNA
ncbi:MAG: flagellar protein FlgN [Bacteriovoracaceae bacterium]|nr:flagellar protein FlgN [Bacteriovoracaceae bacterium]